MIGTLVYNGECNSPPSIHIQHDRLNQAARVLHVMDQRRFLRKDHQLGPNGQFSKTKEEGKDARDREDYER